MEHHQNIYKEKKKWNNPSFNVLRIKITYGGNYPNLEEDDYGDISPL